MPRKKTTIKECVVCHTEFETLEWRNKTCSAQCRRVNHSKWVKENQSGENNPFYGKTHTNETKEKQSQSKRRLVLSGWKPANYIDGRSQLKASKHAIDPSWRRIRKQILARDKNLCQFPNCESKANAVHHIIPLRLVDEHKPENLISLCKKHHNLVDKKEKQYEDLFLGIVRDANGESPDEGNPVA